MYEVYELVGFPLNQQFKVGNAFSVLFLPFHSMEYCVYLL